MTKSANRSTFEVMAPRSETQILCAHLTGAGAGNLTLDAQESLNGEVLSGTHVTTGVYSLVFRYSYPELKAAPICSFIAATPGIDGVLSAMDPVAGTATLTTFVGATPTDLASGDTIYLTWVVRNSGKNK